MQDVRCRTATRRMSRPLLVLIALAYFPWLLLWIVLLPLLIAAVMVLPSVHALQLLNGTTVPGRMAEAAVHELKFRSRLRRMMR